MRVTTRALSYVPKMPENILPLKNAERTAANYERIEQDSFQKHAFVTSDENKPSLNSCKE